MISVRERIMFAVGDIFAGGGASLISVLYLIFLTDLVGLQPALAGTAILVAKLWDAVNDPLVGALSDRTRTPLGRRRPWILGGGLLVIGAMAVLWLPNPPVSGQIALMFWVMGSYIIYNTISTIVAVPYNSMSSEVATDPRARNLVNITRLLCSTLASASISLIGSRLIELHRADALDDRGLYLAVVFGFGGLFTAVTLTVALGCRERVPMPEVAPVIPGGWWRRSLAPLQEPAMRRLVGMHLCQALSFDVIAAMLLYYSANVVRGISSTVFLGIFIAINIIAFPIISVLVKRVSKHRIYRFGIPLAVPAITAIALYPAGGPPTGVYLLAVLLAAGMAGAQLLPWIIFPDVVDAAEVRTGRRDSGAFASMMTFIRGICGALVIQIIGLVLQFTGYRPGGVGQPDSAVWGIRLILLVAVAALLTAGFVISARFPLTATRTAELADELAARRAGTADPDPSAPDDDAEHPKPTS